MSDDEKPKLAAVIEHVHQPDGSVRVDVHGSDCERAREIGEHLARGEAPPHPDAPRAARCGPAKVTTDAYRTGWEGIFGAKPARGEA